MLQHHRALGFKFIFLQLGVPVGVHGDRFCVRLEVDPVIAGAGGWESCWRREDVLEGLEEAVEERQLRAAHGVQTARGCDVCVRRADAFPQHTTAVVPESHT